MARHRYRYRHRNSTSGGAVIGDVISGANRAPWWAALLLGVVPWLISAFFLPAWIEHQQAALEGNPFRAMIAPLIERRMHWLGWIGNACLIAGVFVAVRSYLWQQPLKRNERGLVAFLARLLGRNLD